MVPLNPVYQSYTLSQVESQLASIHSSLQSALASQEDSYTMERDQCEQQAYILKQQGRKLTRHMREFVEDDINTSRIKVMEADLARIRDMKDDYQDAIEVFLDMFSDTMGSRAVDTWNREVSVVGKEVKVHADKIRTRAAQISAVAGCSANSDRTLEIQEATLKLQELSINNAKAVSDQQRTAKTCEDLLSAESEANVLMGE